MAGLVGALQRRLRGDHRPPREVARSDQEWRERLTAEQYRVLRAKGTERPFSGENIHPSQSQVTFRCAGCDASLFRSEEQFDSGTGWPSFSEAVDGAVDLSWDFSMGMPRTEAVCRRCGGHLGHRFHDGPRPTGLRYCINAAALTAAHQPS